MVLLVGAFFSCKKNDNSNTNGTSTADHSFMAQASYSNMAEVDAGQLASTQGNDAMVRSYGHTMVSDHTTAENDLQAVASQVTYNLPSGVDSMHMALKAQLATMSGRAFDSMYMHMQVNDHNAAITLFQNEASNGYNQNVKNYANKYLPKLQMHKQMADSIIAAMHF